MKSLFLIFPPADCNFPGSGLISYTKYLRPCQRDCVSVWLWICNDKWISTRDPTLIERQWLPGAKVLRKDFETFLVLRKVENYSQTSKSTVGILAFIPNNSHPCLKHNYWFQERVDPQLLLNNNTCNQPLTFGDIQFMLCVEPPFRFFLALFTTVKPKYYHWLSELNHLISYFTMLHKWKIILSNSHTYA